MSQVKKNKYFKIRIKEIDLNEMKDIQKLNKIPTLSKTISFLKEKYINSF